MNKSDRIKSEVSLREVAEAAGVAWDLKKSSPNKGDWWGPCPLHGENTASFHVVEKGGTGGFFKCFGCHEGGTVIDFTMKLHGLDFVSAVRRLAEEAGIAGELSEEKKREIETKRAQAKERSEREAARQAENGHRMALRLWQGSDIPNPNAIKARGRHLGGAILPQYLTARGVRLSVIGGVPGTLRVAPCLDHWDGGYDRNRPADYSGAAMIGAIGREKILGVHRTWITPTARARHQDGRKVEKQWIGRTGELMGQPCVLSPPSQAVVLGEGIETTLVAYSDLVSQGGVQWSAEAALSRGAITGPAQDKTQLWTPRPGVQEVLILGEGSSKNPREARELYEGAAARLRGLGLSVLLTVPHDRWDLDQDFADVSVVESLKG
ncbi:CHC2 zinc finger domain-containing protein [Ruegeria atlantica]|uniref:CHC2 zinc finger domain-containing protein n=1 Tax=Ruegeria atlantica TaxID=81569 RepID=UPI001480B606|nr:CHC2 zinc finger domain-containing protein [Ruegeria atlantica]